MLQAGQAYYDEVVHFRCLCLILLVSMVAENHFFTLEGVYFYSLGVRLSIFKGFLEWLVRQATASPFLLLLPLLLKCIKTIEL